MIILITEQDGHLETMIKTPEKKGNNSTSGWLDASQQNAKSRKKAKKKSVSPKRSKSRSKSPPSQPPKSMLAEKPRPPRLDMTKVGMSDIPQTKLTEEQMGQLTPKRKGLIAAMDKREAELKKQYEGTESEKIPAVTSGVVDRDSGEMFFAENVLAEDKGGPGFNGLPQKLHPLLKKRVKSLFDKEKKLFNPFEGRSDKDARNAAGFPGSHSEIQALDQAIKARDPKGKRGADPSLFQGLAVHNRSLRTEHSMIPNRCVNCMHVTTSETTEGKMNEVEMLGSN